MTQEPRRPLHRLTPLRDDPAATWLTRRQRLRVAMTGVFGWIGFSIFLNMMWWAQVLLMYGVLRMVDHRLPSVLTIMAGIALVWPARRMIMRRRSAKMAELVRDGSPDWPSPSTISASSSGSPTARSCRSWAGSARAGSSPRRSRASRASASRSPAIKSIRACSKR